MNEKGNRPLASDPTSALQIGLLWHTFGHDNLGVDALARGHANLLRDAAAKAGVAARFLALGGGQKNSGNVPADVTLGPAPQLKPLLRGEFGFLQAIKTCDIVFDIGEGDSFTDIYGVRRCGRLIGTKLAVMAMGRPLVLAPQTIGPFDNAICRRLAVSVMRRAKGVFTRDNQSTRFALEQGVADVAEFMDVAFAVPVRRQDKAGDRLRVGLNVSGLLYNQGYTGKNELGMSLDYAALTHTTIERFQQKPGVEVHLLAHVHGGGGADDDAPVMQSLKQRYPGVIVAPLFDSAEEAKSFMSGMNFVIAGRMHACIGAFSAGTPVVPIAYSRKFNGLFGTLGYPHYVDGRVDSQHAALGKIMAAFDHRADLAANVAQALTVVEARLAAYQDRLAEILSGISAGRGERGAVGRIHMQSSDRKAEH